MTPVQHSRAKIKRIPNADFSISMNGPYLRTATRSVVHLNHVSDTATVHHVYAVKDAALLQVIHSQCCVGAAVQASWYFRAGTQTKHLFIWKT